MKIYFLRHEDRFDSLTFFTPLTKKGKLNSINLIKDLEKLNITKIISSPYLRTLQTIEPFIKKNKLKVNLENSVREMNIITRIPEKEGKFNLPDEFNKQFNINLNYKSFLENEKIIYPENVNIHKKRILDFFKYLIKENYQKDENILIVSHAGAIQVIINKLKTKKEFNFLSKIRPYYYPLGKITQIVDNKKLVFNPINWKL